MNWLITKCIYEKYFTGFVVYAATLCFLLHRVLFPARTWRDRGGVSLALDLCYRGGGGSVLCCSSKHNAAGRKIPFCQVHWWMGLGVLPYRTENESGLAGWSRSLVQPACGSCTLRPYTVSPQTAFADYRGINVAYWKVNLASFL
jgi:hypothetical protein